MAAFEEMGVLPEIGKAVEEMEWTLPTDVQAEAIPLILGGGDVLMAAETGSGKTGAFCLPIMQIVWETLKDFESGKGQKNISSQACMAKNKSFLTAPIWTVNLWDKGSAMAVTPDGLRCQSREQKEWHGCRANKGIHSSGKFYYEATVTDEGLCRVGWSTSMASLDLGTDKFGFGFGGTGKKSNNKQFDNYGEAFGMNDVIGCYLNLDDWTIIYSKNGISLGQAFSIPQPLRNSAFFPAVVLKNAEMSFNFGGQPFKYEPVNGYIAVCQAPKNCIKNSEFTAGNIGEKKTKINNAPQAIIIEPSRELAEQTYNQITKFKKYLESPNIKELLIIGGINIKEQINALSAGIDIVVSTPGRLEDLISSGHLSLTHCRFFVLDEADGLLKQGYSDLIDRLHKNIPKITSDGKRLQMIVCSATLHAFEVKKMADRLMHFPTWVDLKGEDAVPETVHHVVVNLNPQADKSWQSLRQHIQTDGVHAQDNVRSSNLSPETLSEAVKMLKGEYCIKAIDKMKMDRAIIFCRTKLDCDNLEKYFNQIGGGPNNPKNPYSCVCLHGDRKPPERKANLEKFKQQKAKFLICTDVAARGIDIGGLPFMINITLPDEKSNYVHRIGRVGRAERMGLAISLVSTVPEKVWFHGEWCPSRGRNCWNTNLTDRGGCCIWFNENRYLAEIEDHLNVTIQHIDSNFDIPVNDFDGKVVYGEKLVNTGSGYETHVDQMAPTVKQLAELESHVQKSYLRRHLVKAS